MFGLWQNIWKKLCILRLSAFRLLVVLYYKKYNACHQKHSQWTINWSTLIYQLTSSTHQTLKHTNLVEYYVIWTFNFWLNFLILNPQLNPITLIYVPSSAWFHYYSWVPVNKTSLRLTEVSTEVRKLDIM